MATRRVAVLGLLSTLVALLPLVASYGAHATAPRHSKRPQVSINDIAVTETDAAGLVTFTVSLKHRADKKVTVAWATADGTATSPADYTAEHGTVVFKGRTTKQTVTIPVNGDDLFETAETFAVDLTSVKHGVIKRATGTATIVNDDSTPAPAPPPVMRTLTVTRSGLGTGSVTSNPAGISCPPTCATSVTSGTVVTLTAHPATSSAFVNWTGACAGASLTCPVTMTSDKTVGAAFKSTAKLAPTASAAYGTASLSSTFTPDPYTVGINAGGPVDVSYLSSSCHGFTTTAPTLKVSYGGSGSLLRFYYVGSGDATIVVNDPYGNYYCVDDSFGTVNPTLDFTNPAGGTYDVWVGVTAAGTVTNGTLSLTKSSANHP